MFDIDIEYKRGVLFVRLSGIFNKMAIERMKIVDKIIIKAGIKYLLINFEKAIISKRDIEDIITRYNRLIEVDGKIVICGYNHIKLEINYDDVYTSQKEINAFNIVNI